MANVPESESYDAGIYQLEILDEVLGGVNGKANNQAKGLANRTKWLKAQVDALNLLKGKSVPSFSIANSYVAGEIVDYQKNIYRASTTITPGAWNAGQWTKLLGTAAESELASVAPLMSGTAAAGTSTQLARQDHVHPADTGREAAIATGLVSQFWSGLKTWRDLATDVRAIVLTGLSLATSTVVAAGDTLLVAIGKLQAQITLRAPLADPALTGTPTAPTAAPGTNTTQVATTAFTKAAVDGAAATAVQKDSDTGAAYLPAGTIAQRGAATAGRLRFNGELMRYEGANGTTWNTLGGATGGGSDAVFYLNDQTVNNDYTVVATQNAMSAGPIAIADGKTITVASGAVWTVV